MLKKGNGLYIKISFHLNHYEKHCHFSFLIYSLCIHKIEKVDSHVDRFDLIFKLFF